MSLKEKTVNGLIWSFIDNSASLGISFIVGIVMARLLTPREYGLIGMITIFIAVSQSFIDSGFGQALIRKKNPSQADYSTVFYFNLVAGLLFFLLLFFSAGAISSFYKEPLLQPLIRVLSLSLIINAFTIIQRNILTKRIDFKLQTKISIISATVSGIIGISMALSGYGVWSLVAKTLAGAAITSLFLWLWNRWRPSLIFNMKSFRELFSFGSKLLISGLIDTIYNNIYYLIIGKYFSAKELGYYTRADQFKTLPSQNMTAVVQRVSYPVLSSIQDDIPRLKEAYKKLIRSTMLLSFVLMMGMAAIARPMIITLIGVKWAPSVIYLQMLCFVGMFYPLQSLNLNMLQVQGRSDLFLVLEIIKKVLAVPVIIIGIVWGIKMMILGMMVNTLIAYYLNSYWSGRFIGYSFTDQVKDIAPSFLLGAFISIILFTQGMLIHLPPFPLLIIQLATGTLVTVGLCEGLRFNDYLYIKTIVREKFLKTK